MVAKVNWQGVWQNDHKVKPPVMARQCGLPGHPVLCRAAYASPAFFRHGLFAKPARGSSLDLDKGKLVATAGDKIYLADGQAHTPRKYAIAFQAQPQGSQCFSPPAMRFCGAPVSHRP